MQDEKERLMDQNNLLEAFYSAKGNFLIFRDIPGALRKLKPDYIVSLINTLMHSGFIIISHLSFQSSSEKTRFNITKMGKAAHENGGYKAPDKTSIDSSLTA